MANPSIRKYPLKLVPKQTLKLDPDAVILPNVYRRWDEPVLYVLGDHKPLNTKVVVRMFSTAVKFAYNSATMHYLGNFFNGTDCFHFFKVDDEPE